MEDLNHGQGQECHGGSVRAVDKFPDAAFHIMAHQIGDHDQNCYDKALEEHVKAHASGEDPFLGIPGLLLHDIGFALFHTQSQSREAVGDQVDP